MSHGSSFMTKGLGWLSFRMVDSALGSVKWMGCKENPFKKKIIKKKKPQHTHMAYWNSKNVVLRN